MNIKHKVARSVPLSHLVKSKVIRKNVDSTYRFTDDLISKQIQSGNPSLIGRLGATEARVLGCYLDIFKFANFYDPIASVYSLISTPQRLKQLKNGAGIFPSDLSTFRKFSEIYLDAFKEADILACWGETFTWSESYSLKNKSIQYVHHHATSPWVEPYVGSVESKYAWSNSLTGKKVLIISGFSKSMENQFARIDKIFPTVSFPNFDPIFLKAPLSQGGSSYAENSFDLIDSLKEEMRNIDFDILLVSAGGYSLPLAHFAKVLGKVGIHCAGELQLFFGILGARWDNSPKALKYKNEFWTRPLGTERPANWLSIENGCYW